MSIGSIRVTSPGWATFGYLALPGQAVEGFQVGPYITQTDVKTRWPDGSIQHALVCAKVEIGEWAIASGPASGALFSPAWPIIEVHLQTGGTIYTVTFPQASSAMGRFRYGSEVLEVRDTRTPMSADANKHPLLQVKYDVRVYRDFAARAWLTIQNIQDRPDGNRVDYDLSVIINGQEVYSRAGVSHPYQTAAPLIFPVNLTEAEYTLDLEPFHAAGALPRFTGTSQEAYDSTGPQFGFLGFGDFTPYMPSGGARPEIGQLPDWCARFIEHQDRATRAYMLAMARASGSFSGHLTTPDGHTLITIESRPAYWFDWRAAQNGLEGPSSFTGTALTPDGTGPATLEKAHLPAPCYVPYLVTGDRFYLDQVKQWANYALLATYPNEPGYPRTLTTLWDHEVRGWAWGVRNVAHAAFVCPDSDPEKGYFRRCVEKDLTFLDQQQAHAATASAVGWCFLGAFGTNKHETGQPDPWVPPYELLIKPWQYSYMAGALDQAQALGFAGGAQMREWLLRWFVSTFHDPGFPSEYFGPYYLHAAEVLAGQTPDQARGYALAEAWARTFDNGAAPPSAIYTSETHGPLAIAERLGVTGATDALDWLRAVPGLLEDVGKRPGLGAFVRAAGQPVPPDPEPEPPEPQPAPPTCELDNTVYSQGAVTEITLNRKNVSNWTADHPEWHVVSTRPHPKKKNHVILTVECRPQ